MERKHHIGKTRYRSPPKKEDRIDIASSFQKIIENMKHAAVFNEPDDR